MNPFLALDAAVEFRGIPRARYICSRQAAICTNVVIPCLFNFLWMTARVAGTSSMAKPIHLYKLTPAQIGLVEKLASAPGRNVELEKLEYRRCLSGTQLNFVDYGSLQTKQGSHRADGTGRASPGSWLFSKGVVLRLTEPQINLLRFLDDGPPGLTLEDPLARYRIR